VKDKRLSKVAGALVVALVAFGCGTGNSTSPSVVARVNGEGSASKMDGPQTASPSLEFEVLTVNRDGLPVRLTVEGKIAFGGVRAGSAIVTINMPDAFDALAVGHSYRLVEVQ
jgi:hypothetical protein